jgi:hypothetical protein
MRKSCSDSEKLFLTNYEDTIYLELTQECLQEIEDKISPAENLALRADKAKVRLGQSHEKKSKCKKHHFKIAVIHGGFALFEAETSFGGVFAAKLIQGNMTDNSKILSTIAADAALVFVHLAHQVSNGVDFQSPNAPVQHPE